MQVCVYNFQDRWDEENPFLNGQGSKQLMLQFTAVKHLETAAWSSHTISDH